MSFRFNFLLPSIHFFSSFPLRYIDEKAQPQYVKEIFATRMDEGKPIGQVINLVGSNFNRHIFDGPNVDVLAFFYAPW
jgi:hypothetical protein